MFGISRDERVAFLTELLEQAAERLDSTGLSVRQEIFALIAHDLQTILRAQQQEREEGHPKHAIASPAPRRRWGLAARAAGPAAAAAAHRAGPA